ncbi:MAG: hypothetical protein L6R42_004156 [Xanthoria sp. 1 TBL-2021]|nr:MAG: hypothetical protein L6R42_004156 [Xanthoria sp. 1 TBL-2021]
MSLPTLALPGQLLGASSTYNPGPGTHLHASNIYASLPGRPTASTSTHNPSSKSSKPPPKQTLTITRLPSTSATADLGPVSERISNTNALPRVGDVVLGRVTRCMTRQVNVGILIVLGADGAQEEGMVCANEIQGVVRREDVRATEKEKVVIGDGFRVGDLVRAVVISLGDQSNYYLTTAKNELGVIMAKSEYGNTMYPISWKEFKDPATGETETRKVAKPF